METSTAQECVWTSFPSSSTVTKLVPLTVAEYGETFLAMEVNGKVLFLEPLPGLGFDGVIKS